MFSKATSGASDFAKVLQVLVDSNLKAPEPFGNVLRDNERMSVRSEASVAFSLPYIVTPEPPLPGSNLGPFSLVSGWLLRTRSLDLALIIGMLGFGLLGSAAATFVRERKGNVVPPRDQPKPIVEDLAGVLIRGLSAAIIVFLAALGGLAILGTGPTDPNPYVLFLGCLIGAVFSQKVWGWAYEWLTGDLDKDREKLAPAWAAPAR